MGDAESYLDNLVEDDPEYCDNVEKVIDCPCCSFWDEVGNTCLYIPIMAENPWADSPPRKRGT